MLQLSNSLQNIPVMSLRTSNQVATAVAPIINPKNLKIEGFWCQDLYENKQLVLLTLDIRDTLPQGFAINDHENLAEPDELIRLSEVLEMNFQPIGKPVYTLSKEKVGKVVDYALESTTFYIQKLYVGRPFFKSLTSGQLSVDRTQIIEITPQKIIIQEILKPKKAGVPAAAPTA